MTQIQTPRFLMPLFVSIEVDEPDRCQQIGQFLWSPWAIGFGHSYRVDAQGVHALPDPSLVKRIVVVALAILLWPITLLATVLGNFITASSATQRKAYAQIKNWNIGVAWQNDRPEIRSNQLLLRPIHIEDLPTYQALFNSEYAMRYATGERFNVTEQFYDWLNQWGEHPFSAMAVVDLQSNRVIGHAMLEAGNFTAEERGYARLSILIDPAYRNDGFDEERATERRDHIGLEVTRMLITYARALRERGALVPAYVDAGQNAPAERVHHDATGAVDWVYIPLNSIITITHRNDIAARRIGARMVQEIGARTFSSSPTRERFSLRLSQ